ncbi:MAG: hypothetical protein ABF453_10385, partial [Bifidobacterium psychraerophilum]|uniref:hypothetical protein n=1 Tax=Bifidobacterium psychraerophilum TaxID=218140 RepID=UPI0039E892F4
SNHIHTHHTHHTNNDLSGDPSAMRRGFLIVIAEAVFDTDIMDIIGASCERLFSAPRTCAIPGLNQDLQRHSHDHSSG